MPTIQSSFASPRLLSWVPPPRYWRVLLAGIPVAAQRRVVRKLLANALASEWMRENLQPIADRRLGIEVRDLDLHWVFELHRNELRFSELPAEATVSGTATDLLLLASRLEDADTLFFQRRLALTGDVELGLLLRNLLDRLPWETLPLSSRILLQRGAGFADRARAAYRARKEHAA